MTEDIRKKIIEVIDEGERQIEEMNLGLVSTIYEAAWDDVLKQLREDYTKKRCFVYLDGICKNYLLVSQRVKDSVVRMLKADGFKDAREYDVKGLAISKEIIIEIAKQRKSAEENQAPTPYTRTKKPITPFAETRTSK